jgi:predicted N-formylglutamate amidohydrolase
MGHPRLFSELTRHLDPKEKRRVIARHYRPYRDRVEHAAARAIARGRRVIHISAHSFTPVWEGAARSADVGLLYDPGRERESSLCSAWAASIEAAMPGLRVRRNYPYRGISDGLVTYLRKKFVARDYLGIEVELNQRLLADRRWPALLETIAAALAAAPGLRHGTRSPKITRPSRSKPAR